MPYSKKLDFGGTSPVAIGYVKFGASTYTVARGFGWVAPSGLAIVDTKYIDALTRDCVRGGTGTFQLDVPNGRYEVIVTTVDPRERPDAVKLTVGGIEVTLPPPAQDVVRTVLTVDVTEGKLSITPMATAPVPTPLWGLAALEVMELTAPPPPPPPGELPDLPGLVAGESAFVMTLTHRRDRTPYLQGAFFVRFQASTPRVLGNAVPPPTVATPGAYALELDAGGVVGKAGLALVGASILSNTVRADAAVTDGQPHTLCVSWDAYWMRLYLDGALVAEGNKGLDPEPSQITDADYFQGLAPEDLLATVLDTAVTHSLLADQTWDAAQVGVAHAWAGGAAPPPPPPPGTLAVSLGGPITSTEHTVTFAPVTTGGTPPYAYSWNYGDGTTGAESAHRYDANGTYTALVVVTDASTPMQSATATVQVTVAHVHPDVPPPPSGRFYFTRAHGDSPPDRLVDYCYGSPITTVKAGDALDPTVWSTGAVPGANDRVNPNHALTLSGKLTVHSWRTGPAGKLTLNAGAELWCVTFQDHETSEFACAAPAQIVIRDKAIDTTYDPEQYGHGLLITGGWTTSAAARTPYLALVKEALKGDTTLALSAAATGWKAGDKLVLPDMRQLDFDTGAGAGFGFAPYEWKGQEVTIASVSADARTVTLTTPLAYDCKAVYEPDGATVAFRPVVGHLSRGLVIRSENPAGTRGHVLFTDAARVNGSGVEVRDCGRTTNAPLDSTVLDGAGNSVSIGTNQMARYGVHFHHCHNRPRWVGNSVWNGGADHLRKWGIVLHGTSDALIADNVLYNWAGSGINTEDGNEQRNVIERNYVIRVRGPYGSSFPATGSDYAAGVWMIDTTNIVRGNLVNSVPDGIGIMFYPKQLADGGTDIPLGDVSGNKVFGATSDGFHIWNLGTTTVGEVPVPWSQIRDLGCYHFHGSAIFSYNTANTEWVNFDFCGDANVSGGASPSQGFNSAEYVLKDTILRGGKMRGISTCFVPGNVTYGTTLIEDCYFDAAYQNVLMGSLATGAANAERCGPRHTVFRRVRFGNLVMRTRGEQRNYVMQWSVYNGNLTALDLIEVFEYNGNPADHFRLYYDPQQRPEYVLEASIPNLDPETHGPYQVKGSPEPGLTNAQLWAKYGIAAGGAIWPGSTIDPQSKGVYDGVIAPIGGT